MTSLFDTSPSDLFPASSPAPESSSGYDVEAMIAQLAEAADCSLEEAAGAVARHIQKEQQQQANAQGSAMKLRTDKERAEYMRQLRSRVAPNVWIPPQMQEEYASEQRVAAAQEAFAQRMRERSVSQGPMRSAQAAIEFFKQKP